LENGSRRIAYVSGPEDLYISKKRKEGYLRALSEFGVAEDPSLVLITDLTLEGNLQVAQQVLQMKPRPEAVFCMIDPVAVDVLTEWKKSGIRIPEDIALAGFTDNPTAAVVEPPLTTVSQPGYDMGKLAVSHLLDQLDGLASEDPISIVLDTTLVVRKSSQHFSSKK
jgi:LacI family transcriptional regulator